MRTRDEHNSHNRVVNSLSGRIWAWSYAQAHAIALIEGSGQAISFLRNALCISATGTRGPGPLCPNSQFRHPEKGGCAFELHKSKLQSSTHDHSTAPAVPETEDLPTKGRQNPHFRPVMHPASGGRGDARERTPCIAFVIPLPSAARQAGSPDARHPPMRGLPSSGKTAARAGRRGRRPGDVDGD